MTASMIEALPEYITLEHEQKIVEARSAYEALTTKQKNLVMNYDMLEKALEEAKKVNGNNSGNNSNGGKLPNTGAVAGSGVVLLLGAITAAAGKIIVKRKNK